MALRSFAVAPNNKWVLKALATKEAKGFSSKFILFFDSTKAVSFDNSFREESATKRTYYFIFYKSNFILRLYNAYDSLPIMGDFVALVHYHDIESFSQHLRQQPFNFKSGALKLVGCLLLGAFANL